MIKQIIKSQDELEKLIREELKSPEKSNNQHGDNTEEELQNILDTFFEKDTPESYPVVAVIEFDFIYRGFDVNLNCVVNFFTPTEIAEIHNELNVSKG